VAPSPIESALARNTDIDQLCMVGMNLTQPMMVVTLTQGARERPRPELERQMAADMEAVNADLEDHEKIAKILIGRETWTIDNGYMTPTMKVKRNIVEERYHGLIEKEAKNRSSVVAWE
jgi:long-chain acyl-CoA synthetase